MPTRLFRVSFTGELGYDINVPAIAVARSGTRQVGGRAPPDGQDAFEVECWRRFAVYILGFLREAARGL